MKIFLDDLRVAPEKYDLVFRTGEEFIKWVENNPEQEVSLVSFDHDLGEHIMDGYDVVKRMVDLPNNIKHIQYHTDNLIGLKNMFWYLKNAKEHGLMSNLKTMNPKKIICIDGEETVSAYYNALKQ